ncbi:MAG: aminopeptidase [Sphaerochaetaceae bacterium]
MKSIEQLNKEYAKLVIETGINLYKGQSLLIKTGPAHYEFAQLLALTAYERGAQFVKIDIDDFELIKSRLENQDEKALQEVPDFSKTIDYEMMVKDWAYIRIDNTEDRHFLEDADPQKLSTYRSSLSISGRLYQQSRMRHEHPWCVICAPGPVWAQQILGEDATVEQLWSLLAPILKLDAQDPSQAWQDHSDVLTQRGELLDTLQIKELHFSSSKTDLRIGFTSQSRWKGGGDPLPSGRWFMPNLPTEEVFTTPDRLQAEGYVETTRPVSVMGSVCEGVRLTFTKGKVTSVRATKGQEVMEKFLSIDEGSSYLGEVALVDEQSPISQSKKIFHSILYDENASCHIALGAGYPSCLAHAETLTSSEKLLEAGCNQSLNHTDFMIGSDDMDIVATTYDNKEVPIMRKGSFAM